MSEVTKKTIVTETTQQVPDVVEETRIIHRPTVVEQPVVVQQPVVQTNPVVTREVVEEDSDTVAEDVEDLADGNSLTG